MVKEGGGRGGGRWWVKEGVEWSGTRGWLEGLGKGGSGMV